MVNIKGSTHGLGGPSEKHFIGVLLDRSMDNLTIGDEKDIPVPDSQQESDDSNVSGSSRHGEDSFGTDLVHFLVGPSKKKFTVHKSLLTASPILSQRCQEPLKSPEITLLNDNPKIFSAFVESLYNKARPTLQNFTIDDLITLYIFSVDYSCTPLKDHAMDVLQNTMKESYLDFTLPQITKIFSSVPDSTLSIYVAALISHSILVGTTKPELIHRIFKRVPEASLEFIRLQRTMGEMGLKLEEDPRHRHFHDDRGNYRLCDFHDHEALGVGERCVGVSNCEEYCSEKSCCDGNHE